MESSGKSYRRLYESMRDAYASVDMEGRIQESNQAYQDMLGYSEDELRSLTYQDLTPRKWHEFEARILQEQVVPLGHSEVYEKEYRRKDGVVFPVELRTYLMRDDAGRPVGMWAIVRDVTERRRAEAALQQRVDELAALNSLGQAIRATFSLEEITRIALDGLIGAVRPDLSFLFLREGERLVLTDSRPSNGAWRLNEVPEHRVGECMCGLAVQARQPIFSRNIFHDPRCTWEECKSVGMKSFAALPLRDGNDVIGVIGLASAAERDFEQERGFLETLAGQIAAAFVNARLYHNLQRELADRKQAEEARAELLAHVAQSQRLEAIGTLAGGIAHDFNNILGAIMGNAEIALSRVPEEQATLRSELGRILQAAERAASLVRQILFFSRQERQEKEPFSMRPVVKEALKLLRATLPSTIQIRENIETEGSILGDPTQIHQIVMNFCTNAGRAMQNTGGVLEVGLQDVELDDAFTSVHSGVKPGRFVKLSVRDTGRGIPPEILGRIFEPFFTTRPRGEGTGLGLSVVHGIVTEGGGTVTVESEVGRGTLFCAYLPRHEAGTRAGVSQRPAARPGKERILLVDDDEIVLGAIDRGLKAYGYLVSAFINPLQALEAFRAAPGDFDLVVTDLTMPGLTGDALARELRKTRPDVPVILATGYSESLSPQEAEALGLDRFVRKPLLVSELTVLIREAFDERSSWK